jgi:hypothetical protein
MPGINGTYDLYELTAGALALANGSNYTLTYPAMYLTNFSTENSLTAQEILANITSHAATFHDIFRNKQAFIGGFISIILVLCGIVTASWMLFLLLLLSANSIPNSLILSNLFFCATYTAMLTKLTNVLRTQVAENLANTNTIQYVITFTTDTIILRSITSFFIWLSWIDLLVQINKHTVKRQIIIIGMTLACLSLAFSVTFLSIYWDTPVVTPKYQAIKVIHYIFEFVILLLFTGNVIYYSWLKRKFAYHRKTMALAIFCLLTLISPMVFTAVDLASDAIRTWATYVYTFSKLCVTIAIWEWLHTIRALELRYEKKTVLGRRISNDSFADAPDDTHDPHTTNSYILKSVNIVSVIAALKSPVNLAHRLMRSRNPAKQDPDQQVQLYDMVPAYTRNSNLSQQTSLSLEAHHPQFEVDHRYLRNTPSTVQATTNPTPVSYFTGAHAQLDISEDIHSNNDHRNDLTSNDQN